MVTLTTPEMGVAQLSRLLQAGEMSAESLVTAYLERIKKQDKVLNAFITVTAERALAAARQADKARQAKDSRPLLGIPIAHKDLFCTKGVRTTCGSKMLENFIAPYDATVVSKCENAGLISLGKTNMDEFAMGCSNETSFFGAVSNPWDLARTPGGSSGGSAAAVAGALVPAATASDTGGSIRLPAAFCGMTGLKPTYGRVSRYGMVAFASSLDQGGLITRTAEDAALLLNCIAGPDARDATSIHEPWEDPSGAFQSDLKWLRIGIPQAFLEGLDADCRKSFDAAVKALSDLGAQLTEITLPHAEFGVAAYHVIAAAEASTNLSRYDGVRFGHRCEQPKNLEDLYVRSRTEGFGLEVKRRILIGAYALSAGYQDAYYLKAQSIRRLIQNDFQSVFKSVHVIATPTTPGPAFLRGEKIKDPVSMYQQDAFTAPANLTGLPCISLPAPLVRGLPYGLHLMANVFDEAALLKTGFALQQATNWHLAMPPSQTANEGTDK